jgi:hypothetical protein
VRACVHVHTFYVNADSGRDFLIEISRGTCAGRS